jgi:DNA-binding phage protein
MSDKSILDQIRDIIEERGGIGEFSKKSGIRRQTLYKLFKFQNPTLKTIFMILKALGDISLVVKPIGDK